MLNFPNAELTFIIWVLIFSISVSNDEVQITFSQPSK